MSDLLKRKTPKLGSEPQATYSQVDQHLLAQPPPQPPNQISKALVAAVTIATIALVAAVIVCKEKTQAPPENDKDLSNPTGWVAVIGSILIFGSYGILIKSPEVQGANVDPVVFQVYYSVGVALSSLLVLTYTPFIFSWWGVLGALLWVLTALCAFVGIQGLGYAVAIAIWAGLTIVISFLWGSLVFGQSPTSIVGSVMALVSLVVGVAGVASCQGTAPERIRAMIFGKSNGEFRALPPVTHHMDPESGDHIRSDDLPAEDDEKKVSKGIGFVCAILVGLFNGSLMVPFHYFNESQKSGSNAAIAYLTSFSFGVMMVTPVTVAVYLIIRKLRGLGPLNFHVRLAPIPGFITGIYWSSGNFCAIHATQYLGDTLGYPLTQGAIVVAALWGIIHYKEVTSKAAIIMFAFSLVFIFAGAGMLALFG